MNLIIFTLAGIGLTAIELALIQWLKNKSRNFPKGHEDENGFHTDK